MTKGQKKAPECTFEKIKFYLFFFIRHDFYYVSDKREGEKSQTSFFEITKRVLEWTICELDINLCCF